MNKEFRAGVMGGLVALLAAACIAASVPAVRQLVQFEGSQFAFDATQGRVALGPTVAITNASIYQSLYLSGPLTADTGPWLVRSSATNVIPELRMSDLSGPTGAKNWSQEVYSPFANVSWQIWNVANDAWNSETAWMTVGRSNYALPYFFSMSVAGANSTASIYATGGGQIGLYGDTVVLGNRTGSTAFKGVESVLLTNDFGNVVAGGGVQTVTVTVSGASTNDTVHLGLDPVIENGLVYDAWVSATNTVKVRANNVTGLDINPSNHVYRVTVISF